MWTVTFVSNRGTEVAPQQLDTGELVAEPTNVTKENYTLLGWYTDANFTLRWDFDTDTVSEDITLYAKWRLTIAARLKALFVGLQEDVDSKIPLSQKGQANGVAELDADGTVPIDQINDAFNEVLQVSTVSNLPLTGESGKLYVTLDTKKVYMWDGSNFVITSNRTFLQPTEPPSMIEGDIWFSED